MHRSSLLHPRQPLPWRTERLLFFRVVEADEEVLGFAEEAGARATCDANFADHPLGGFEVGGEA